MIMLGSEFDLDPQVGWAREQLTDYSIPTPKERIDKVFRTAVDYLGQTAGPDCEYLVRALIRLRKHDVHAAWSSTGEEFEDEVAQLLSRLYPQKAAFQGDDANRSTTLIATPRGVDRRTSI
jgi:hypothetical protein